MKGGNMKKCLGCMRDYAEESIACPVCGYSDVQMRADIEEYTEALKPETILAGRFIIGRVLDLSDFSIIYLSWDALLKRRVVIREYFPYGIVQREDTIRALKPREQLMFEKGKEVFEDENRILSRNQDIPELVNVYRCFRENGTSYSVSEYLVGYTLQDYLDINERFSEKDAENLFFAIMESVDKLHKRGIVHLNLAPENIYLRDDKSFKLIDFGRAKEAVHRVCNGDLSIFDDRYTAPEVLDGGAISGAADMYSLGMIYYQMLTGKFPPKRGKKDALSVLKVKNQSQSMMIEMLTELDVNARPGSADQLRRAMAGR